MTRDDEMAEHLPGGQEQDGSPATQRSSIQREMERAASRFTSW